MNRRSLTRRCALCGSGRITPGPGLGAGRGFFRPARGEVGGNGGAAEDVGEGGADDDAVGPGREVEEAAGLVGDLLDAVGARGRRDEENALGMSGPCSAALQGNRNREWIWGVSWAGTSPGSPHGRLTKPPVDDSMMYHVREPRLYTAKSVWPSPS